MGEGVEVVVAMRRGEDREVCTGRKKELAREKIDAGEREEREWECKSDFLK